MKPQSFDGCLVAMIVVPLLCIAGITAILTQFLYPHYGLWSLLIALPIALVVVVFSVAMQGHDALDIIVGSLMALFFCFILLPVFARARTNRQHAERKMRSAPTLQRSQTSTQPTFAGVNFGNIKCTQPSATKYATPHSRKIGV